MYTMRVVAMKQCAKKDKTENNKSTTSLYQWATGHTFPICELELQNSVRTGCLQITLSEKLTSDVGTVYITSKTNMA